MPLIERIWAVVTSFVSIVTLSPIVDNVDNQVSLQPLLSANPIQHEVNGPVIQESPYPIFPAPGASEDEPFKCEYPEMDEWERCTTPGNRGCWLRRKDGTDELNIYTDYEKRWPKGVTRHYHLNLADEPYDGDGLPFDEAKLFNHMYPGPWIQACWGDQLVVKVTNRLLYNGTSVHWHGIRQLNSTHMDGVNGITQCPIAPGDYFIYNFTLTQYGSSWYHSHYSVQYADGAAGPLTIHGPTSENWDEAPVLPLIMTDWYHKSSFAVIANFKVGKQETMLLNGRGNITKFYNDSTLATTEIQPPTNITFHKPGKRYLLRVINTSFDTTFIFSIDNHWLHVVSADFVPIKGYNATSILVGIGQRYNVIVEAKPYGPNPIPEDKNFWIRTEIADCFGGYPGDWEYETIGILRYNDSSTAYPSTKKWHTSRNCSDEKYENLVPVVHRNIPPPVNGNKIFGEKFDVFGFQKMPEFPLARFALDSEKVMPMRIDYSDPTFLNLDPSLNISWPDLWRVEEANYTNEWVYLVIEGQKPHPIHLHGHDFAILNESRHAFNPKDFHVKTDNPPRRDVVLLPEGGYIIIAFKTDNPGPWLVHCHIAAHISFGLGMQILEDQPAAFALWPNDSPEIIEAERVCKNWRVWQSNMNNWEEPPKSFKGPCNSTYENATNDEWCFQNDAGV